MKYADIARGALVLALGMMTGTVLAQNPQYAEDFESSSLTNVLEATGLSLTSVWTGGEDDISAIVEDEPDQPTVGYPLDVTHTKVLQLNTEGGTLTNSLITPVEFDTANIYVDSMVKFVPSEDLATIDDTGVKVAVYAYIKEVGETVSTNLALYHGAYSSGGYHFTTNTVVTNLTVDASAWYRLTILLANDDNKDPVSQAFQIFINGVLLTNDNAHAGAAWTNVTDGEMFNGPDPLGTWFVSAASLPESQKQVASLQFRGTGFVDDLVVGGEDPFEQGEPPANDPFGITQNIGLNGSAEPGFPLLIVPAGATTSVTYTANAFFHIDTLTTNTTPVSGAAGAKEITVTFNATNDVVVTFAADPPYGITQNIGLNGSGSEGPGLIIVPAGTTKSVTYTAADFYVIQSLTTNTTEVSGAAGTKSAAVIFDATNDVVATFAVAAAYASAPIAWFTANGWGEGDIVAGDYANLQMLNVAATNTAAGGTITIEAIEVVGDDVKVTVFIDRTMSMGVEINGVIKLYGAETLAGGFTEIGALDITIGADQETGQDDIRKEISFPNAGNKKFFKAHIEAATTAE